MYLNLFFKSVKADAGNGDGNRVKAMIKRFVQLLVSGGSGATEFTAGGLYLLGEVDVFRYVLMFRLADLSHP
jgi:ribosome biogenesis protein MAK21